MKLNKKLNKNIFFRKHYFSKNNAGFTLIETLVAITVLVVSIVGPMEIASKSLFSAFYARDEITAYYLAQEGIEYVRNARDTLFLYDFESNDLENEWLRGFDNCILSGVNDSNGCLIDVTVVFDPDPDNLTIAPACDPSEGGCPYLKFDEETGVYDYDENSGNSKFKRKITIEYVSHGNSPLDKEEAVIKSEVSWTTGTFFSTNRNFTLTERLYNWQR